MPKKENFDFKHKNPAEIKTDEKKTDNTYHAINVSGTKEKTHDGAKKSVFENPLIKPKAEPRNKRVQLLLTEGNHLKIKEYAANSGTSVNDAINQIIENI